MFPLKTILFGTDFSPMSQYAYQMAVAMARDYAARLVVVHVLPYPSVAYGEMVTTVSIEDEKRHSVHELERLRASTPTVNVDVFSIVGDPAEVLLRMAEAEKADLILIGTHGRTGLLRLLMGSVAEQVLRKAPCPVMTVRMPMTATVPDVELVPEAAQA